MNVEKGEHTMRMILSREEYVASLCDDTATKTRKFAEMLGRKRREMIEDCMALHIQHVWRMTGKDGWEMNEFNVTEWKLAINNFLWSNLPGDTTLNQAEAIACKMLQIVEDHYIDKKEGIIVDKVNVEEGRKKKNE